MLRPFVFVLMIASAWSAAMAEQPRSGIDVSAIDRSVPPQQDFWQFANGKWLAATPIPADRSAWDTFSEVREKTQGQLRSAIGRSNRRTHIPSTGGSPTSMPRSWMRRA